MPPVVSKLFSAGGFFAAEGGGVGKNFGGFFTGGGLVETPRTLFQILLTLVEILLTLFQTPRNLFQILLTLFFGRLGGGGRKGGEAATIGRGSGWRGRGLARRGGGVARRGGGIFAEEGGVWPGVGLAKTLGTEK